MSSRLLMIIYIKNGKLSIKLKIIFYKLDDIYINKYYFNYFFI